MRARGTRGRSRRAGRWPVSRQGPFAWWAPLAWWAVGAALLAVIVLSLVRHPGPLDDPDPADQRPGFLTAAAEARELSGLALPGDPVGRRAVLVAFDRSPPPARRYASALAGVPDAIAVVLVIPREPATRTRPGRGRLLVDPEGRVAEAMGIHRPSDGGPPMGYAVLDADGRVRYATLDPSYLDHGDESALIAEAVR